MIKRNYWFCAVKDNGNGGLDFGYGIASIWSWLPDPQRAWDIAKEKYPDYAILQLHRV